MQPRPSPHEICKKIEDALSALRAGRIQQVVTKHIYGDLADLEIDSAEDQLPGLLIELLEEIQTIGPIECYAGCKPPQRSHEPELSGLELWAYSWYSKRLGRSMYLKFALKKEWYIYVDCHRDNPHGV
jgi:hypothetical protein